MILSVIVATLNSESTLNKCIEGLEKQSHIDFEVIFVDGGSTDATLDLIRSANINNKRLLKQEGTGIAGAWNTGLKIALGKFLHFHNSDDYYDKDIFKYVISELERFNSMPVIGFGDVSIISIDGDVISHNVGKLPTPIRLLNGMPFMHPSVFFSRELVTTVGYFSEFYRIGLDADWLLRAFKKDVVFCRISSEVNMLEGGLSDKKILVGIGEYAQSLHDQGFGKLYIGVFFMLRGLGLIKRGVFRWHVR